MRGASRARAAAEFKVSSLNLGIDGLAGEIGVGLEVCDVVTNVIEFSGAGDRPKLLRRRAWGNISSLLRRDAWGHRAH